MGMTILMTIHFKTNVVLIQIQMRPVKIPQTKLLAKEWSLLNAIIQFSVL
uniref:Uncharacterized protein n=1 Tax=Arundo donax TaxID=35708 RepID=A0A0A9G3A4_ARUDO